MLPARITLAHFSVSSAMNLPKSAGEPGNGVPPRSAGHAFHLEIGQAPVDFFVEFIDDLGGRALHRTDAEPTDRLVARYEFAYRRDIRQHVERVAVVTASARNLPAWMYSITPNGGVDMTCT